MGTGGESASCLPFPAATGAAISASAKITIVRTLLFRERDNLSEKSSE
jgi:hypothetical protein